MKRCGGTSGSYGHYIALNGDAYEIRWEIDIFPKGCAIAFPHSFGRKTDRLGALRFAKKWGCEMPASGGSASKS